MTETIFQPFTMGFAHMVMQEPFRPGQNSDSFIFRTMQNMAGNGTRSALCFYPAFLDDHWSCPHRTFNDASCQLRRTCEGLT